MKLAAYLAAAFLYLVLSTTRAVQVGDVIPADIALHQGFPPQVIPLADRLAGKKVILVGLPGAFVST